MAKHSQEKKEHALALMSAPENCSVHEASERTGIPEGTLYSTGPRFADKPTASIPSACPDRAETQAVYRFLDQARDDKRGLGWEAIGFAGGGI